MRTSWYYLRECRRQKASKEPQILRICLGVWSNGSLSICKRNAELAKQLLQKLRPEVHGNTLLILEGYPTATFHPKIPDLCEEWGIAFLETVLQENDESAWLWVKRAERFLQRYGKVLNLSESVAEKAFGLSQWSVLCSAVHKHTNQKL